MTDRVLSVVKELGKARYSALCARLPFDRPSIAKALQRLKKANKVLIARDETGEYWTLRSGGL